jgi:periplasmic divalent cation tolerance protein
MKSAEKYVVVMVTAPDLETARLLARGALEEHLAACANLAPQVESHYWWEGKLETSSELLILFKTEQSKLNALEEFVLKHHPYDTPEFLTVRLSDGTERYLEWLTQSLRGG